MTTSDGRDFEDGAHLAEIARTTIRVTPPLSKSPGKYSVTNAGKSCAASLLLLVLLPCIGLARQAGAVSPSASPPVGVIEGTVTSVEDYGIAGVIVTLEPLRWETFTDQNGAFAFRGVPPGAYVVHMATGALVASDTNIDLAAGQTIKVKKVLQVDFKLSITTTVSAASKVKEQQLEAPAAISVIDEKTIALEGGAKQMPSVLQTVAGAEYTQSGLYDIQFNTRGFNATLSRRVQVLLDGRDLAAPENKNQEWISSAFLTSELESIEFVRGPAAALYGANSINGVVAMTTKTPRGSPGGRVAVTTGELGTLMTDFRWAGPLGHDWYTKLVANHTGSDTFSQSRTETVEYPGLPLDVVPALTHTKANAFDARFDKYFASGRQVVLEGGYSQSDGGTYLSQAGRFSILDSKRSWSRAQLNTTRWTAQAYVNTRNGELQSLFAPTHYPTSGVQFKGEVQGNRRFASAKGRVVFGASYLHEHIDSADSSGAQTLFQRAVTTKEVALFGQLKYDISSKLKVVTALRWDESTLHTAQFSPKAALVYLPLPNHSLHVTYNQGFQVGNYNELFVGIPLAAPLDLSAIENAFAPILGGVSLGFNSVPVYAYGNPNLDVEKVQSVEIGYVGSLGSRARITVDAYRNRMRDFITDIVPGVNPAYPPYQAPATLPAATRAILEQTVNSAIPGFSNLPNGNPQIVYSLGNVGLVTSRGLETGVDFRLGRGWSLDASYTRFDFTLVESQPGLEPKPNAPENRAGFGVTYVRPRFAASFRHRWVDRFEWASGLLVGDVPRYNVSEVNASYDLKEHWQVSTNIANVFDRRHYEMFGGDILRRRAIVTLAFTW